MLNRQAIVPRMRFLWIALATAGALTIALVGGLIVGPHFVHRHHRYASNVAVARHDIASLDLANYWRWHNASHLHAPRVLDPWGTPYRMTPSGQGYAITSAGPDRVFGTADDVR
jgi:hypothetical protein